MSEKENVQHLDTQRSSSDAAESGIDLEYEKNLMCVLIMIQLMEGIMLTK